MKFLIVGLGNPGAEYEATRHNAGFMALDLFAARRGAAFRVDRLGAVAETSFRGKQLLLLKPSTYMNNSGRAVAYWLTQGKIPVEQLLVMVDDLALPLGSLRLRLQGSDGGHNGLKDIAAQVGTQQYARLRLGIGHEFARGKQVDFVLDPFSADERPLLDETLAHACDAVEMALAMGFQRAMNQINTEKKEKKETPVLPQA
ncbi:MAG: aminoacyl-tRNA hydrolase [Bacteroides sp.]